MSSTPTGIEVKFGCNAGKGSVPGAPSLSSCKILVVHTSSIKQQIDMFYSWQNLAAVTLT